VLYRTDAQSAVLCEALDRSGIPFKKGSHALLTDLPAVQALLDMLNCSGGDTNGLSLALRLRVAAEELEVRGSANALDGAALQSALSRLTELAASCAEDHLRLLNAVALASEADFWDPRADRVSLLTLHAAKGLEFPVVFIVGLEDGILPLRWGEPDEDALAEERRLFYVGMTRAKDRLILSRARKRPWRGRVRELAASPFLSDIEAELLKHQQPQLPRRKPQDRQLSLL
jgi:DNA helicase-2/ATP-dependent DNA helicase PcrA